METKRERSHQRLQDSLDELLGEAEAVGIYTEPYRSVSRPCGSGWPTRSRTRRHRVCLGRKVGSRMSIDRELSRRVARAVRKQPGKGWQNCWRAIRTLSELADARYVEGWVVTGDLVAVEHAWIEMNGSIVDPTFLRRGRVISYHPAFRVDQRAAQQMGPRLWQRWPLVSSMDEDEAARERYRAAELAALAESRDEAARLLVLALRRHVGLLQLAGGPSEG